MRKEQLETLAEESDMPASEYVQETLKALRHDSGDLFVYSAECSESGQLHLTWKKQLAGGVRFKLGSVDLDPCDPQVGPVQPLCI